MNVLEYALSHSWLLPNLPGASEKTLPFYSFYVGELEYIERGKLYLHIPEIHARDAEGRPRYPEQETWTAKILVQHQIQAQAVWYSHWQFNALEDACSFIKILWSLGACRIWHWGANRLASGSAYSFEIIPSQDIPFGLQVSAGPGEALSLDQQSALLDKIGIKNRLRSGTIPGQPTWVFETIDAMVHCEHAFQQMGAVYLGEV